MELRATGQLTVFLLTLLSGTVGGSIFLFCPLIKKYVKSKPVSEAFDFLFVALNFIMYFFTDLYLENGKKRIYTVLSYVAGVIMTLYVRKRISNIIKRKKKNV